LILLAVLLAVLLAFHHLAGPGIAVTPGLGGFDQAGLDAVAQAAAAVWAAVGERQEGTRKIVDHDRAAPKAICVHDRELRRGNGALDNQDREARSESLQNIVKLHNAASL
jgi:hypothetical protein